MTYTKKSLAWLALAGLTACNGANGSGTLPQTGVGPASRTAMVPARSRLLQKIAAVGDSLTAGYQAGGFLGATGVKDPIDPGVIVPPGQENGWWADLDEQASGLPIPTAIAHMYDPTTSPLPLIAAPGLNNQLVPAVGAPFGPSKSGDTRKVNKGFNQAGYLLSGLSRVRMNPNSSLVRNLGVPGITLHEAVVLSAPQSNTCESLPGIPGLLNAVVAGESSTFWPVLGNFANMGANLSDVNAAAQMHPTLTTIWLGANDLLKFMGSGGRFTGGDNTAGQVEQDIGHAIRELYINGSSAVVADLPNILETPYFQRVDIPKNTATACAVRTYFYCTLLNLNFSMSDSQAIVTSVAKAYNLNTAGACTPASTGAPCGYVTLQGALGIAPYFLATHKVPDLDCTGTNFTPPCTTGSGMGTYYITPAFSGRVQSLNNVINQGIDNSAKANNVPLVPISKIFDGLASGNRANPYFRQAASINPGICCTLTWQGGLTSFDSLHPSNTGYAIIAYYFIQTINTVEHQHIPQIDIRAAYNGTRCAVKAYCFPDVYAPH